MDEDESKAQGVQISRESAARYPIQACGAVERSCFEHARANHSAIGHFRYWHL